MGASARCNNLDVQTFVPTKMLREQNISKFLVIRSKFHSHCVITSRPPSGHASRQWANASWNLGSLFKILQRNCVSHHAMLPRSLPSHSKHLSARNKNH